MRLAVSSGSSGKAQTNSTHGSHQVARPASRVLPAALAASPPSSSAFLMPNDRTAPGGRLKSRPSITRILSTPVRGIGAELASDCEGWAAGVGAGAGAGAAGVAASEDALPVTSLSST